MHCTQYEIDSNTLSQTVYREVILEVEFYVVSQYARCVCYGVALARERHPFYVNRCKDLFVLRAFRR